jgi:hypothetical protein
MPAVTHTYQPVGSALELFQSRDLEILLSGSAGTGKAQPLTAIVQTPVGPRPMGDLMVGDLVLGADGQPVKVIDIPFRGIAPVWRLTFTGGQTVECSDGHLWQTNTGVLSVADMLSAGLHDRRRRRRFWIPQPEPAEFDEQPVPVAPYTLGVLLGDGYLRPGEVSFTTPEDAQAAIDALPPVPDAGDSIHGDLDALGLRNARSHDKFVPEVYKVNSAAVRRAVLQGLMDTDGYSGKTEVSFCSVSRRLAEDVQWLAESLGGIATITTKQPKGGRLAYQVWLRMPDPAAVFHLDRKRDRAGTRKSPVRRYIEAAELVGDRECQCITVSAPDGLYLTERFVVTHNSRACLEKLHLMCLKYKGMRGLILRKTAVSLTSTALVTFREIVAPEFLASGEVKFYSGSRDRPACYVYRNGSTITVGGMDKPTRIMSSEYDCLTGDALVVSPSEVQRAYGRPYSGKLVTITTTEGNKLTGTPNHPVLTSKGWVGLGSLSEGDYVVSRCPAESPRGNVRPLVDPDVADQPVPIAEVARTLAQANGGLGRTERRETHPVDFHGDGAYGYVDVVTSARLLHRRTESVFGDQVFESERRRRDFEQPRLVSDRPGSQGACGLGGSHFTPPGSSKLAHPLPVSRGAAPGVRSPLAAFGELALPLGVGSHPGLPSGERVGGGLPADASLGHFGFEPGNADVNGQGYLKQPPLPGEVTLDRVVNISVTDAGPDRHVYNLQTEASWYYANNIISHNCAYVQEATELELGDWEYITTRLRNGVTPYQQLMADTNPGPPQHWLKARCDKGPARMVYCKHEDNPRYYRNGAWTDEGTGYLKLLDNLTGVRKQRLRFGLWVSAEGLVYDGFDPAVHISDRFNFESHPPDNWPRYLSVDFGFTNPFNCQWWTADPDGRLYLYREIYMTGRLVEDHAKQILRLHKSQSRREPNPSFVVCDHDAEDRATLYRHLGWSTIPAHKDVKPGIEAVQSRMKIAKDGKPRIFFCRSALVERDESLAEAKRPVCTIDEMSEYVWDTRVMPGAGSTSREAPKKENDHGMDATRYQVAQLDLVGRPSLRFF